ncbi:putative OHCU decarboxylase|nr:putative OHCU decarboxylase [Candidatus Pantoea persica]
MNLATFNALPHQAAQAAVAYCVAILHWQQALVAALPFASPAMLLAEAERLAQRWNEADLAQALTAYPRIGERARGAEKEAALQQAMLGGNRAYEARFGRVFLIRASGSSGDEMLAQL